MLLTIDVGNTNTVLGVFEGKELRAQWRLKTDKSQTADEYGILTRNLFMLDSLQVEQIKGIMVASVVPTLNTVLEEMAWKYFHIKPLFLNPGTRTGMAIHYDNPQEVGADRIADSVAAYEKYGGPCIVVDFGTAITFDVISEKGEYLGGAIAPGLGISAEALFERAAKLPRVEIREPQRVWAQPFRHKPALPGRAGRAVPGNSPRPALKRRPSFSPAGPRACWPCATAFMRPAKPTQTVRWGKMRMRWS